MRVEAYAQFDRCVAMGDYVLFRTFSGILQMMDGNFDRGTIPYRGGIQQPEPVARLECPSGSRLPQALICLQLVQIDTYISASGGGTAIKSSLSYMGCAYSRNKTTATKQLGPNGAPAARFLDRMRAPEHLRWQHLHVDHWINLHDDPIHDD